MGRRSGGVRDTSSLSRFLYTSLAGRQPALSLPALTLNRCRLLGLFLRYLSHPLDHLPSDLGNIVSEALSVSKELSSALIRSFCESTACFSEAGEPLSSLRRVCPALSFAAIDCS
jgi:hypothetical protein